MTAVYPSQTITEFYNGSSWYDISAYVVGDISGMSGFGTPSPSNRMASLGTLNLTLNNAANLFTVYGNDAVRGLSTLTGWKRGAKIRVKTVIGGSTKRVWTGRIADIQSDDNTTGTRRAHVKCVDYIDVLTRYPMKGTSIMTNATVDVAASYILSLLTVQPESTSFDAGIENFPAIFSNIGEKTKAIGELNKLLISELGYGYILKDGTFRIENKNARVGNRALDKVGTYPTDRDSGKWLSGDTWVWLSGDTFAWDATTDASLTTTTEKYSLTMDDQYDINTVFVKAYPVRVDTSLVVVASLGSAQTLAGYATLNFSTPYTNPSGGGSISAINVTAPVATTDYQMWSNSNGTGTDLTASLVVTATAYGDRVEYELTNVDAQIGYITKLQARGYGIYFDSPIEMEISDSAAIDEYADYAVTLDQRYKRDQYAGAAYARRLVEFNKLPRTRILKAEYTANISGAQMMSCLDLDIGSLVSLYDNKSAITKWYYIYSRQFTISPGGLMSFTFGCEEAISSGNINPVAIEFSGASSGSGVDTVDFGYIPEISNLIQRSYSFWFYSGTLSSGFDFFSTLQNGAGVMLQVGAAQGLIFSKANTLFAINPNWVWFTSDGLLSNNTLYHIVLTHDSSTGPSTDPIFYVNAVSKSITARTVAGTDAADETGTHFILGDPYGKIQNFRIYNRILSSTEVTTLYNSGTPNSALVTSGLVFDGFYIDAGLGTASSLNGSQIPTGSNYIDKIYGSIGTPSGTPIIRVPS